VVEGAQAGVGTCRGWPHHGCFGGEAPRKCHFCGGVGNREEGKNGAVVLEPTTAGAGKLALERMTSGSEGTFSFFPWKRACALAGMATWRFSSR
jgi:hypothetical protein